MTWSYQEAGGAVGEGEIGRGAKDGRLGGGGGRSEATARATINIPPPPLRSRPPTHRRVAIRGGVSFVVGGIAAIAACMAAVAM